MKVVNLNPKGKIEKQKNYVYQLIIFTTKKKKGFNDVLMQF